MEGLNTLGERVKGKRDPQQHIIETQFRNIKGIFSQVKGAQLKKSTPSYTGTNREKGLPSDIPLLGEIGLSMDVTSPREKEVEAVQKRLQHWGQMEFHKGFIKVAMQGL